MEESNLFLSTHRPLVITLGGLVLFILIVVPIIKEYFSPIMRKERKVERERKAQERIAMAEEAEKMRKIVQQIKQQEIQIKREDEQERYKKWRDGLQKMPKYETWRQQVFSKYGRRCEICGKTEELEIHHSKKSLHLIYKEEGFNWIMVNNGLEKAIDKTIRSGQLWNVDNGSVLCHVCHERQDSSQFFLENNKQN